MQVAGPQPPVCTEDIGARGAGPGQAGCGFGGPPWSWCLDTGSFPSFGLIFSFWGHLSGRPRPLFHPGNWYPSQAASGGLSGPHPP